MRKNVLFNTSGVLFLLILFCSGSLYAQEKDAVVEVTSILELRSQDADETTVYKLTGEAILTFQQAWRNQKWIQDETAGILVDDNAGIITSTYKINDGLTDIKGRLVAFRNNLQFIPVEDWGPASSSGNTPVPVERTIDELTADDQGRLVVIEDVEFDVEAGTIFVGGQNYNIFDESGNAIFRAEFRDVDYIGAPIPQQKTTIVAIVHLFFDDIQIIARSFNDMGITEMHNMAALRMQKPDNETVYTLNFEAFLTHQHGNRNQKYIQDSTAAMMIDDSGGIITTQYMLYDGITGIKGKLDVYNEQLQLIPVEDPGQASSTGNEISPLLITLEDLKPEHQSMLVRVNQVSFGTPEDKATFSPSTNYSIYDATATGILRTPHVSAALDYFGTPVPSTPRDIVAVINQFRDDIQLMPRALADFIALEYFTVSFNIVDEEGEAIDDVVLTFGDEELEPGVFVIEEVPAGSYTYKVTAEGYKTEAGLIAVEEDLVVEIVMVPLDPDRITEFPFTESFEGEAFPPSGWTHYQLAETGGWEVDAGAAHHSFFTDGEADNWLVTPQIELPDDEIMLLNFMERNQFMNDYGYSGVWISTGSGNPELEHFVELYESDVARGEMTLRTINLADYMGEIVYLAFVYQGDDAHRWWVDNVEIEAAPGVLEFPNIAALVDEGRQDGTVYRITGEVIITHLQQAYRGQFYVQDETAAILIDDPAGVVETSYELYDGITGFTGELTMFQNMFQILPTEDPGQPSSTGNTVAPLELTLADLTEGHQGMLVIVRGVSFKDENPETFVHNQSYMIYDATDDGEIRTPNSPGLLDYFGMAVPTTPKDIIAVVHQRFEVSRLQPRMEADFLDSEVSAGPILETVQVRMYPNPAHTTFTVDSGDQPMERIRVFNLSGQLIKDIRVSGHQVQIDVGSLITGMYLVQVISGESVVTQRIQINR